MKFNAAHTQQFPKAFQAIKRAIAKSTLQVDYPDWQGYCYNGKMHWADEQAIYDLMDKAGYKDNHGNFSMAWETETEEHGVVVEFKKRGVLLTYNIYLKAEIAA